MFADGIEGLALLNSVNEVLPPVHGPLHLCMGNQTDAEHQHKQKEARHHSHSMVAGGLLLMS